LALGLGMRTIWIALRAVNYTDYAFRAAIRNLDKLKQKEMEQILLQRQLASATIRMGLMYATMGSMILSALFYMSKFSTEGSQFMSVFQQKTESALGAIGEQVLRILQPALKLIMRLLDMIAENEALAQFIAILGITIGTILLVAGAAKVLMGAILYLKTVFMAGSVANSAYTISLFGMKIALDAVVASAMKIMIIFILFYEITSFLVENFGVMPALILMVAVAVGILAIALWKAAIAMSVLTWGAAAIIGIGAALAAWHIGQQQVGYQMGTRFVPHTGLALVHEGEIIYNPSTGRPTGFAPESTPTIHQTEIKIEIGEVHTKADFDDLDIKIRRALRDALREKE